MMAQDEELEEAYARITEHVVNTVKNSRAGNADELLGQVRGVLAVDLPKVTKKNAQFTERLDDTKATPRQRIANRYASQSHVTQSAFVDLNSALSLAADDLMRRLRDIIAPLRNTLTPIRDIKNMIAAEFEKNGILSVVYKNGARVTLEKYASTVARTARVETDNLSALATAGNNGTDYVYVPLSANGCPVCGAKSDRVYCVSGNDPNYPKVWGDLFEGEFANIHPNCRCRLVPWHPEQYTDKQKEELLKKSQRTFTDKQGNPLDVQSETARKQYIKQQDYNRMVWNETKEWEAIKAMPNLPWKSIGAFRRSKRADSETYREWVSNS